MSKVPWQQQQKNEHFSPLPFSICTCQYIVIWKTIGPNIQFSIYGTKNGEDDWIGIGFNKENKKMNGTDIILGYFDKNNNGVVKDYYSEGQKVKEDKSQDIFDTGIARKDGSTILKFKRKIVTSDKVIFCQFLPCRVQIGLDRSNIFWTRPKIYLHY